jgi:hypothetical protein
MERLVNSSIIIDIELIEVISGGNQNFEVLFIAKDKKKYKVIFNFVCDMRYSIENGYIDRFSKFVRKTEISSSVLLIENSKYIEYFTKQVSGTRPIDTIKNYIMYDEIDTVVEFLTYREPVIVSA